MFAVIRTGGKQYRVEPGSTLEIERIAGEAGEKVEISEILLVSQEQGTVVGTPTISGARVKAKILEQGKGPKVVSFKKIRRHGKIWKKGHRQELTTIQVTEIHAG